MLNVYVLIFLGKSSTIMRAQPLILAKCWSLFVRGRQWYFEIITRKSLHTRWVIRGPLFLLFLLSLPVAVILLLLASLSAVAVYWIL